MTEQRPDLYAILGVPPHATPAAIGHAYRSLLRRHHPDTRAPAGEPQNALSDAAVQEVLAAYTVLRDPDRRARYDRETRRRADAAPRAARVVVHLADDQPPIVAGPVWWHRA